MTVTRRDSSSTTGSRPAGSRSTTGGSPRSSLDDDAADGAYVAPGFVDVHVHGWGGHDAMGDRAALDGMARRLLRRGVTSFLPTAVTAPLDELAPSPTASAPGCPTPRSTAPSRSGSTSKARSSPPARRGAHDPRHLLAPADAPLRARAALDGLRADHHRARAGRRAGPHRLAPRRAAWPRRSGTRRRRSRRHGPASRPARRRRPTSSTR